MEEKLTTTPVENFEQFETSEIIESKKNSKNKKLFSKNQFIKYILLTFTVLCFCLLFYILTQNNSPKNTQSPMELKPTPKKCGVGYKNEGNKCVIDYSIKAIYFTKEDNENINLIGYIPDFPIRMVVDGKFVESTKSYIFPKKGEHTVLIKGDFSKLTSAKRMFYKIHNLIKIEFTQLFDTKNIKDMKSMFYECTELTSIDLSHFNTKNVVNMEIVFAGCRNIRRLYKFIRT